MVIVPWNVMAAVPEVAEFGAIRPSAQDVLAVAIAVGVQAFDGGEQLIRDADCLAVRPRRRPETVHDVSVFGKSHELEGVGVRRV
jgi:hypothetical protein